MLFYRKYGIYFYLFILACFPLAAKDQVPVSVGSIAEQIIFKVDYEINFSTEVEEFICIDDARISRRNAVEEVKIVINQGTQIYLDFLHHIFSIVPNRGAPFECVVPKQLLGYGILYLKHLF